MPCLLLYTLCAVLTIQHSGKKTAHVVFLISLMNKSDHVSLQAIVRADMGPLLEQVSSRKESLSFMRRRIRRLAMQWAGAARRLDKRLRSQQRQQKRVSLCINGLDMLGHSTTLHDNMGHYVSPRSILSTKNFTLHKMNKISDAYSKVCLNMQHTGQCLLK